MGEIRELFEERLEQYKRGFYKTTPWFEYKKYFNGPEQRTWPYSNKLIYLIIKLRRIRDYGDK